MSRAVTGNELTVLPPVLSNTPLSTQPIMRATLRPCTANHLSCMPANDNRTCISWSVAVLTLRTVAALSSRRRGGVHRPSFYSQESFLRATAGTAIARLSHRNSVCLSVRLSVCLSHAWIRQKRSKLGSSNLHHRLPQRL